MAGETEEKTRTKRGEREKIKEEIPQLVVVVVVGHSHNTGS